MAGSVSKDVMQSQRTDGWKMKKQKKVIEAKPVKVLKECL